MMQYLKTISLSLIVVLMVVMGSMELSMASHAIDHQHHSSHTHTTGICAWMCTAAQTISTDSQVFTPEISRLHILQSIERTFVQTPRQFFLPSRAPPI